MILEFKMNISEIATSWPPLLKSVVFTRTLLLSAIKLTILMRLKKAPSLNISDFGILGRGAFYN